MSRSYIRQKPEERITALKPRNPYALPARQRRAGAHQTDRGGERARARAIQQRLLQSVSFEELDEFDNED